MRTEVPVFKRCCCCLPLRRGLLLWAYVKLAIGALLIIGRVFEAIFIFSHLHLFQEYSSEVVRFVIEFIVLVMSSLVNILLIVAAHKKSSKLLRHTYIGELVAVLSVFVMSVSMCLFDAISLWTYIVDTRRSYLQDYVLWYLPYFAYVGVQLYIVASIRSEVIKLESKHEFRFVNHAIDAECEYYENRPPADSTTKVQEIDQGKEDQTAN